jgi:hypothetical protein
MRHSSSYRSERRNQWHRGGTSWASFNAGICHSDADFGVGTRIAPYRPARLRPSKYMPHIGKKQRAKGARRSA